jgi:hypothetical protein
VRLIVVGAGIGGSALARVARARGHEVTLIAQPDNPHSLAATAVLRRAYHKGEEAWTWDGSLKFYQDWGIPLVSGGQVTNYRTPDAPPRLDKDWHLIDPVAPLVRPDVHGHVPSVPTGPTVSLSDGRSFDGDVVVLTPGHGPLSPSGHVTFGVTWAHPDPGVLTHQEGVRVHHWAPYKSIVAGTVAGSARLGSSSASTAKAAYEQAQNLLALSWDIGMINSVKGWTAQAGIRLQTREHHHHVADRVFWFGGFHRTGYALAPSLAHQLITILEPK